MLIARAVLHGDTPSGEIDVIVCGRAGGGDDIAIVVKPEVSDFSLVVLFHPAIVAIIGVHVSASGIHAVLGIELQGIEAVPNHVTRRVISEAAAGGMQM